MCKEVGIEIRIVSLVTVIDVDFKDCFGEAGSVVVSSRDYYW